MSHPSVTKFCESYSFNSHRNPLVVVTGGSRGIGAQVAMDVAKYLKLPVLVCAKSSSTHEKGVVKSTLPNTVESVADNIERETGVKAYGRYLDLLDSSSIDDLVKWIKSNNFSIIAIINNASALWWDEIVNTPLKKFDLIFRLNCRGSFYLTQQLIDVMVHKGLVLTMSPPIQTNFKNYKGYTAYNISKYGMTMVAMGIAAEYEGHPTRSIRGVSLWPATIIESQASINFQLGDESLWRKATILSDCVLCLICDEKTNGAQLIDDEYLGNQIGISDFSIYRKNANVEPPRLLASKDDEIVNVTRGDVNCIDLNKDITRSAI